MDSELDEAEVVRKFFKKIFQEDIGELKQELRTIRDEMD
jgi:hypothetical protein